MLVSGKMPQHPKAKLGKSLNKTNVPQQMNSAKSMMPTPKMAQTKMGGVPQQMASIAKTANSQQPAATVPRSYAMVISSYENVARRGEITDDAAEQLGETIAVRLNELNRQSQRMIEDLPEYKKLGVESIDNLGEEIAEMLTSEEDSMRAFAFLKTPAFANLMDSKESVHRSFADMMQDNGDEKLLFGALETVSMMNQAKSANPTVSVKA